MPKPVLSIISAMDNNRLIGNNNGLPWHLPEDLAFFKKTTLHKPVIMGRKTYESIGRPLPNRKNIIISHNKNLKIEGCTVLTGIEDVLEYCNNENEIMLIGGASLYQQWLPVTQRMYLTLIDAEFKGDAWFPDYQPERWSTVWSESHRSKISPAFNYQFIQLERKT